MGESQVWCGDCGGYVVLTSGGRECGHGCVGISNAPGHPPMPDTDAEKDAEIAQAKEYIKQAGHLPKCASHKVKSRHGHHMEGVYHDCDCGFRRLLGL